MKQISKKLKQIRKQKGLSQEEVQKLTGINRNNISRYENGKREPNINTLKKLAKAYNIDIIVFFELPKS